ncbi:MAG: response regulator [Planctomycetia bacterium]|nr:response regulator [Planctomycetia bacterium]
MIAVSLAAAARLVLNELVGDEVPFLTFFPAVLVAALYGGRRGGVLATALAALVAMGLSRDWSPGALRTGDIVLVASFVGVNLIIVWLADRFAQTRKEADASLAARARADSQVAQVLDTITDAFATFDRQWRYVYVNDSAMKVYGLRRDEFLGRILWEQFPHLVGTEFERRARRAMETGHPDRFEYFAQRLGRWFDYRLYPSPGGLSLYATDIHERKRAAEELQALLARERAARSDAEHAGRLKDEFLATLSHELRTPLNAILGWASFIRMSEMKEDELADAMATIERNARVQAQLIDDLLDMNQILSGKLHLDVQEVDLPLVVQAALETLRPAADAKQIRIQKVIDTQTGPVLGDPARLQQIVWNLLSNAVKFTPKDGRVRIALKRDGSAVEIVVADTGEGIKPEFLPYVFDRFRQSDASTTRRHGGLGLGLSIVRHLVELQGGTVSATSAGEGQGATFTVRFPLLAVHWHRMDHKHHATAVAPSALDGLPLAPRLDGVKVLVVDDEPDASQLVKRVLEERHATVETAGSAAEALERIAILQPDVLISDIGMPDADGYELIRRLRALPESALADVPAVALTAFARAVDRERSTQAGYQVHLAKPVESTELVAVVANLAGRTESA